MTTKTTKIDILKDKLKSRRGASLSELITALGWQAHSVRTAISGLRKEGCTIERRSLTGKDTETRYVLKAVSQPRTS